MHSSTSDSDILFGSDTVSVSESPRPRIRLDRFTMLLLATVIAVLGLTEAATVAAFDRTSRAQQRELSQRRTLLAVRDPESGTGHVAVLGNSLMLDGTDVPLLAENLDPKLVPAPYFVLATNYYDWFFGLKRLFAEGMRPRYVLLGLSPNQLASSGIRGDYSARYLFQVPDLFDVIRDTHMDPTMASGFLLAHYSEYYSTREVTRGFVLSRVAPSVGELLHNRLGTFREPEIDDAVLRRLATQRLAALDQLCKANGSRFLLVIPPTYQPGAATIARAGSEQGIPVLVPVMNSEFDASYYQSDGFHLNEMGAREFTTRLAGKLLEQLPK